MRQTTSILKVSSMLDTRDSVEPESHVLDEGHRESRASVRERASTLPHSLHPPIDREIEKEGMSRPFASKFRYSDTEIDVDHSSSEDDEDEDASSKHRNLPRTHSAPMQVLHPTSDTKIVPPKSLNLPSLNPGRASLTLGRTGSFTSLESPAAYKFGEWHKDVTVVGSIVVPEVRRVGSVHVADHIAALNKYKPASSSTTVESSYDVVLNHERGKAIPTLQLGRRKSIETSSSVMPMNSLSGDAAKSMKAAEKRKSVAAILGGSDAAMMLSQTAMRRLMNEDKDVRDKTKMQATVIDTVNNHEDPTITVKDAEELREIMIAQEYEQRVLEKERESQLSARQGGGDVSPFKRRQSTMIDFVRRTMPSSKLPVIPLNSDAAALTAESKKVASTVVDMDAASSKAEAANILKRPIDGKESRLNVSGPVVKIESAKKFKRAKKYVLFPDSNLRTVWDLIMLVMLAFIAIKVPIHICFPKQQESGVDEIEILINIFFICDILFNFFTIVRVNGIMITNQRLIAQNYMRSWFALDVIASIPFDSIIRSDGPQILRLVSLIKLLRLLRMKRIIERAEQRSNLSGTALRLFQMVFVYCWIFHWNSCIYWWITITQGYNDDNTYTEIMGVQDSWVPVMPGGPSDPGISLLDEYTDAFFWSITTFLTVGRTISPNTFAEILFTTCSITVGLWAYALIIGAITGQLFYSDSMEKNRLSRRDRISKYLNIRNVPLGLKNRILAYYDNMFKFKVSFVSEKSFLYDLQPALVVELNMFLHAPLLQMVPMFRNIHDAECIIYILELIKTRSAIPLEMIVYEGELGTEMFVIVHGACDVLVKNMTENKQIKVAKLVDGDVFGERSLLLDQQRNASVQSSTFTELLSLDKKSFIQLAGSFPQFFTAISKELRKKADNGLMKLREELASRDNGATTNSLSSGAAPKRRGSVSNSNTAADANKRKQSVMHIMSFAQGSPPKRKLTKNKDGSGKIALAPQLARAYGQRSKKPTGLSAPDTDTEPEDEVVDPSSAGLGASEAESSFEAEVHRRNIAELELIDELEIDSGKLVSNAKEWAEADEDARNIMFLKTKRKLEKDAAAVVAAEYGSGSVGSTASGIAVEGTSPAASDSRRRRVSVEEDSMRGGRGGKRGSIDEDGIAHAGGITKIVKSKQLAQYYKRQQMGKKGGADI